MTQSNLSCNLTDSWMLHIKPKAMVNARYCVVSDHPFVSLPGGICTLNYVPTALLLRSRLPYEHGGEVAGECGILPDV